MTANKEVEMQAFQALSPEEVKAQKVYEEWGMTTEEYDLVVKLLGRLPNYTEAGLYSSMWSEHCSYKNSRSVLKTFYTDGPQVLQGPGEGAGVVDIGDEQAIVFKMESHNSPSAVEPYEGAATGLGGILRDVFSMGARPIAAVGSMRFGELKDDWTRYLVKEAVHGIGDYGNKMGIPTVASELRFEESYDGSPLVNAMAVGLIKHEDMQKGVATGVGNPVMYVGAPTGRDGIHGATFSSEAVMGDNAEQSSPVQAGDPLMEKQVMDGCLDLIVNHPDWIVGIQDMGAAGIASSSSEMASSADSGLVFYTDEVPQREAGMTPYEILLSESQERMLLCVKSGHEEDVRKLFESYRVPVKIVGEVVEGDRYQVVHDGKLVVDVPVRTLADDAPMYQPESRRPERLDQFEKETPWTPDVSDVFAQTKELLETADLASRQYLNEQYDQTIQGQTVTPLGIGAGVVRIPETHKGVALSSSCNSRLTYLNPELGGQLAVAEAAREAVAAGSKPLAITDCLNFGNIADPEVYYDFVEAAKGITAACRALDTPVISGNVSLNNENVGGSIYPTPTIGLAGLIKNLDHVLKQNVQDAGDVLYVIGETGEDFAGSLIQKQQGAPLSGSVHFDLETEVANQAFVREANEAGHLRSALSVTEGGLAAALALTTMNTGYGYDVTFDEDSAKLFSETPSRLLVSVAPAAASAFEELAETSGVTAVKLGEVTQEATWTLRQNGETFITDVKEMKEAWNGAMACLLN